LTRSRCWRGAAVAVAVARRGLRRPLPVLLLLLLLLLLLGSTLLLLLLLLAA
jgi:hypothetical protein